MHVEDIAAAFLAVLHAPHELVHDEAFNVGASAENYRIRDLAEIVADVVPGVRASFAECGGPNKRSYQVAARRLCACCPSSGLGGRCEAYARNGLTFEEFTGTRYLRIKRVRELQEAGRLDGELRWLLPVGAGG